jgi:hypothetical protein
MNENMTVVFHGFLNLTNREKLALVEAMNEYFDSTDERERIRAGNEAAFAALRLGENEKSCTCCGR